MDRFEQAYEEYVKNSEAYHTPPEANSTHITAVRKNEDGDLIAFKTNTGEELDYIHALDAAKNGQLSGVDVFQKYGREIIRSEPDGTKENNFDHLPEF
ncbi:DUF3892 domain-containing protein [Guptibacillus hwajinpoensis]|uniref:DUF3892 domain-containing protein n=1 Tax=Guptibacillus hwajinpoensis TaxID=208199 RepID=UPI0024B3AB2B|nr:DUF3892 domain-containing protein [Pseudalkalibacillus hwajinpoensis]